MQLEMQTYIRLYAKKRCPLLTTKVTSMRGTFSQKEQGGKFGIRKEQCRNCMKKCSKNILEDTL